MGVFFSKPPCGVQTPNTLQNAMGVLFSKLLHRVQTTKTLHNVVDAFPSKSPYSDQTPMDQNEPGNHPVTL